MNRRRAAAGWTRRSRRRERACSAVDGKERLGPRCPPTAQLFFFMCMCMCVRRGLKRAAPKPAPLPPSPPPKKKSPPYFLRRAFPALHFVRASKTPRHFLPGHRAGADLHGVHGEGPRSTRQGDREGSTAEEQGAPRGPGGEADGGGVQRPPAGELRSSDRV